MEQVVATDGFIVALLVCFVVGGLISWLAEVLVGSSLGLFADTMFGSIGALFTAKLLPQIGLSIAGGFIGLAASAAIGTIAVLIGLRFLQRAIL